MTNVRDADTFVSARQRHTTETDMETKIATFDAKKAPKRVGSRDAKKLAHMGVARAARDGRDWFVMPVMGGLALDAVNIFGKAVYRCAPNGDVFHISQ